MEGEPIPVVSDPPRRTHSARCDQNGRLKLPADLHQYLKARGDNTVWVTTVDERTARIYPISTWKEIENTLAAGGEDAGHAEAVGFIARHYGDDAAIDEQGRLLVPKTLRQGLGLENQTVYLSWNKGKIDMDSESVYNAKLEAYRAQLPAALERLRTKGI